MAVTGWEKETRELTVWEDKHLVPCVVEFWNTQSRGYLGTKESKGTTESVSMKDMLEYVNTKLKPLLLEDWERRKKHDEDTLASWKTRRQKIKAKTLILKIGRKPEKTAGRKPGDIRDTAIRKAIHKIRVEGLVPGLVASSRGYWLTSKQSDMEKYISSLRERANSFKEVEVAMKRQLHNVLKKKQQKTLSLC